MGSSGVVSNDCAAPAAEWASAELAAAESGSVTVSDSWVDSGTTNVSDSAEPAGSNASPPDFLAGVLFDEFLSVTESVTDTPPKPTSPYLGHAGLWPIRARTILLRPRYHLHLG